MTAATSLYSANSASKSAAKQAGSQSRAEGEAIAKDRLNATIRNSYSTALAQMQLGLQKRQLSTQAANINAAGLAASGDAAAVNAATGSIGASTAAVAADINQKTQAALDQTTDAFENSVDNYNRELNMMVVNVDQSAPTVRKYEYTGPSGGEMLGMAAIQGLTQFASSYAMKKMSLGLGKPGVPNGGT